jgi:hypothetical protein
MIERGKNMTKTTIMEEEAMTTFRLKAWFGEICGCEIAVGTRIMLEVDRLLTIDDAAVFFDAANNDWGVALDFVLTVHQSEMKFVITIRR